MPDQPPTKKPHKPYNRTYNRKRVVQLAQMGVPKTLIASDQDVAISTITRYLDKVAPQLRDIKRYIATKADILALSQLKNATIEGYIKDHWIEQPDLILSQDVRVQKELLHTLQGGRYYDFQAERLERGQSTDNISVQSIAGELSDTLAEHHQRSQQLRGVMMDRMMDIGDVGKVGG